jgi:thiamine transporter ThiT
MTATYSFDEGLGAVVYSLEYNGTTIADIPVIIEPLLDG